MTLDLLRTLLQAISSLAIAGGLIYTAAQFRAYRRAQHFANFSKLVEMQMRLREMRVKDPALAAVYRHDQAAAGSEREAREYFFNLMQAAVFEIVWYGHTQGQVPEEYFRSWDMRMREIAAEPSFRRMIQSPSMKIMHDQFQRYVAQMVSATPERA